jgi:hypothetical protein
MKDNFNHHAWIRNQKLSEMDVAYPMSAMEYLKNEIPSIYNTPNNVQQPHVIQAMEEYADYLSKYKEQ